MIKLLIALGFVAFLTGCLTYPIPPLGVSPENVNDAKSLKAKNIKLKINTVTTTPDSAYTEIMCRMAGPVKPTDGRNFAQYITDGLNDVFSLAEVSDKNAPNLLNINFSKISFTTNPSQWIIKSNISYNGQTKDVSIVESFETSFMAENACREIANNFPVAVKKYNQKLISEIVNIAPTKK